MVKTKSAIIAIDKGNQPARIGQEELLEERILRGKAKLAVRRWRRYRKELRDRMLAGAKVEPGPFAAKLDIRIR